jgi:hypothetical protein
MGWEKDMHGENRMWKAIGALVVCLAMTTGVQASEYWCDTGYLVLSDCSELAQNDAGFIWPAGTSVAIRAGGCTACPNPTWYDDREDVPDCDEEEPHVSITQDGTTVESEWTLVKDTPCGSLNVLSTSLPPGDYVIQVNQQDGWSVQHLDTASTEGLDGGCGIASKDAGSGAGFIALLLLGCLVVRRRCQRLGYQAV